METFHQFDPNAVPANLSMFGWPLFLMFTMLFVLNFVISRWLTIVLLQNGFITKNPIVDRKRNGKPIFNPMKNSDEFQKAILLWFFPVIGALGLLALLIVHSTLRFFKKVSVRLFLQHF